MVIAGFLDQARPPDRQDIVAAVGDRLALWDRLAGWLETTYGVPGEPLFYGRDTGWVLRFRRSGKTLVILHPHPGGFRALLVIGPRVAGNVAGAGVRPETMAAFESAHAYPDGRWFWLDVTDDEVAADVERLVALKSPPPRRPRRAPPALH